jgi:ribosomal protein S18 acetylase RimI-like enzyme
LIIKEKFSYIDNIQISKLMRKKGLGNYLMKLIEKETKKNNLKKIRLKVFKDNPATKFYTKLGYKKFSNKKTSIILEKQIK